MSIETISDDPRIQAHYEKCLAEGTSHALAEMFAFAQPPGANDDTTWMKAQGHNEFLGDFPKPVRDRYMKDWKAAGISYEGAAYVGELAEFPGDPQALVRGKGDIRKIAEKRGMGYNDGTINVPVDNGREPVATPSDTKCVADDIVLEAAIDKMQANPDLKMSRDLIDQTRDEIKPSWAK